LISADFPFKLKTDSPLNQQARRIFMTNTAATLLDSLQPFAISLLIGLATGIERERSHENGDPVTGMRTFALIALLGTVAAEAANAALTFGLAFFITALVILGYWRSTGASSGMTAEAAAGNPDLGLTTEFAAGLVFALGYLARNEPFLSGILGIALVAILYFRKRLHWFARDVLRPQEITAAILLAIFIFVVIPFLPHQTVDPWNLINPRQLAQVIALIAAIEFCGYASERIVGARVGLLVTGFLGGFASSTAVFLSMSKAARREPEKMRSILGACLLSIVSPLILFMMIIAATSPNLLSWVGPPVITAAGMSAFLGILIGSRAVPLPHDAREARNPLDLRNLLKLALLICGLLLLSALMQRYAGANGLSLVSFIAGLFELHGVTLATATVHAAKNLTDHEATQALLLAVLASFLSKLVIAWVLSPGRFALAMSGLLTLVMVMGGFTFAVLA
jgi:uncharacterized membrane protein (DUF4010 family)